MSVINIGILGLGTVGAGTAKVLQDNAEEVSRRCGHELRVTHASVRSLDSERDCQVDNMLITQDPASIVTNPDVHIIVELIGGDTLARELILSAMQHGKHVVTANKALIALHGNELFNVAAQQGVALCFEAAVAGGISIIKAIREGLAGNQIELLAGIINGTGNFILTEMRDKGRDFADVLKEAQELGYAEADPTFDVEGIDAAHKLSILAAIAFGTPLNFDKVFTEGITAVQPADVAFAGEMGYRIKHLGIAKRTDSGLELRVHPTLIPRKRLIANVDGVMNAVLVKGDAVGNTLHYGAGAGALPTASAVVADIIDVVRLMQAKPEQRVPYLGFQANAITTLPIKSSSDFECAYYLRFEVKDEAGVMSRLASQFAEQNISIEAINQKEPARGQQHVSVILITQSTQESRVDAVIASVEAMPDVLGSAVKLRLEHLD